MSFRAIGAAALTGLIAMLPLMGLQPALAHEVAATAQTTEQQLLVGDEPSDAMTTNSTAALPSKSCGADKKALRMPFADAARPDETP